MEKKEITGFVLAGGNSSRMGADKALLRLHGKTLIEYAFDALKPVCSAIAIIADPGRYEIFNYPVYPDRIKNKGPLAGICTGLALSESEWNFFLCCDSPFITAELFSYLLEMSNGYDAVVPCLNGNEYPLTALYKKSCLKIFEDLLGKNKLKVKEAVRRVNTRRVNITKKPAFFRPDMFMNINTPEELEKLSR